METKEIISILLDEHKQIASYIQDLRDGKKVEEQLNSLLKKHFLEEEGLYSLYKDEKDDAIPIMQTIRNEHNQILSMLDEKDIDVNSLISLLKRHKNVEERLLYPKLAPVLEEKEEKEFVV